MQKLGLLALAVSAAAWVSSTCAEPGAAGSDLVAELNKAALAAGVHPTPRESALSKRIYLYHYFSGDHLGALSDADSELSLLDPDVLMTVPAGLINMGMDAHAIAMLSDKDLARAPAMGNTWFMLAQRASENDEWISARHLVEKALNDHALLGANQQQEALYIQATALSEQNNSASAQKIVDGMEKGTSWYRFAKYNLMLALMREKISSEDLADYLDDILDGSPDDYEARSLYDRFLVTAGKYELRNKHYSTAIGYLRNVSKDSAVTPEGLLQYGWALSKQWQYDQALQPWRVLQDNYPVVNLSVLESLMATAYVAELMQGGIKSLYVYEYAEKGMVSGLEQLNKLDDDQVLLSWISRWEKRLDDAHGPDWLNPDLTPLQDDKTSRALISLFSTAPFIEAQQQLQDIVYMQHWVASRKEYVQKLEEVARDNQQGFANDSFNTDMEVSAERLQALNTSIKTVEDALESENRKKFAFASDAEIKVIDDLELIHAEAGNESEIAIRLADKARLLTGIQQWKIHEKTAERRYEVETALNAQRSDAKKLQEQFDSAQQMHKQMADFYADTDAHIKAMAITYTKLEQLEQNLSQLHNTQQLLIVATAREHLDMLRSRLKDYLATTRLSIARLYDTELRRNAKTGGSGDVK
jgi:hypothetical protein